MNGFVKTRVWDIKGKLILAFNIDKAIDNYNQNVTTEGKKIKRLYFPDGSTLEAQI